MGMLYEATHKPSLDTTSIVIARECLSDTERKDLGRQEECPKPSPVFLYPLITYITEIINKV